jgi:hypothetical protein
MDSEIDLEKNSRISPGAGLGENQNVPLKLTDVGFNGNH